MFKMIYSKSGIKIKIKFVLFEIMWCVIVNDITYLLYI